MSNEPFQHISLITDKIVGISFVVLTAAIIGILLSVYYKILTVDSAALIVSSLLAIATFGYVALTYIMASSMRDEMQHSKEIFKLRRKEDIISIIKNEIRPVLTDIRKHDSTFKATEPNQYDNYATEDANTDDLRFERIPEIEMNFDEPMDAAHFSNEINVNAGEVYQYFQKVDEYQKKHEQAVMELSTVILDNHDDIGVDPNKAQDYAKAALAIEPIGTLSRRLWNNNKDDIMPLRSNVSELTSELQVLKKEIKEHGHSLKRDLGQTEADLRQEYYIAKSDL